MNRSTCQYFAILLQKAILMFLGIFLSLSAMAQKQRGEKKISPLLLKEIREGRIKGNYTFRITTVGEKIPEVLNIASYNTEKLFASGQLAVFTVTGTVDEIIGRLLQSDQIIFIESGRRIPKEELQVSSLDLSVNKINLVHRNFPDRNGEGMVVSVKENKPDTADIDFAGRFLNTTLSSANFSTHASIMATMIAGGGNSWHLGKGAAWGSTISSSDFVNLMPDPDAAYRHYNISVQNHSYGVGVESYYGSDASLYDISALNNNKLLHIFSSGNSGLSAATTGTYTGLTGFANLTGSFKMAKNILTVGASDSFSVVESLSSKGPAHDGRIKPELVAFGEDGSSGAAALASGTALLVQQAYNDLHDSLPSNALLKAVLINSADDVGRKEVDYANGFGSLNAKNAVETIQTGHYFSGAIGQSALQNFTLSIPAGIKKVKVTLVWNDPPALPNANKALINDLDMELQHNLTGNAWLPWVLNSYPHADSLEKPAERKRDSINNVEQITLDNPAVGIYRLRISGFDVSGSQDFFLAYQLDSTEIFAWEFPTAVDFITSSASNVIRWNAAKSSNAGILEYSIDKGSSWQPVKNDVDLSTGFYQWQAPAVIDQALLRMSIGASVYISDTFTISSRTLTSVGFNCPDSLLYYWQKLPGVQDYRVYTLGSLYLDTITVTADSLIVLDKKAYPALHYAVAPLIDGKEGMRSYTIDYTLQGVECYIRSFLGSLENSTGILELSLGTLYGINYIVLEKLTGDRYVEFAKINQPDSLKIVFTDAKLTKGLNVYRSKIVLAGGRVIYSLPETIYNLEQSKFIIFPNPVRQNQPVEVLISNDIIAEITLLIYDSFGRKMMQKKLNNFREQISTDQLARGMYIFRFMVEGEKDTIMKVVIQ